MVKGSNYLEALANVHTVVFDKTGTLTKGEFKVTGIYPSGDAAQETIEKRRIQIKLTAGSASQLALLELAAWQKAPLTILFPGLSVKLGGILLSIRGSQMRRRFPGHGIRVKADGRIVLAGNDRLMKKENIAYKPCPGVERWFIWQRKEIFWVPFLFPM